MIFDLDERTTHFTKINAKLLKAKTLSDYRKLRWFATFADWENFDASLKKEDFDFWRLIVNPSIKDIRQNELSELLNRNESDGISKMFTQLYNKDMKTLSDKEIDLYLKISETYRCAKIYPAQNLPDAATFLRYRQGNYLFNDELFKNLRNLAINTKSFLSALIFQMAKQ